MASEFVNLVTSYVRLTKAVGWVYSFVSHEYIMSIVRRSSSDNFKVVLWPKKILFFFGFENYVN